MIDDGLFVCIEVEACDILWNQMEIITMYIIIIICFGVVKCDHVFLHL